MLQKYDFYQNEQQLGEQTLQKVQEYSLYAYV